MSSEQPHHKGSQFLKNGTMLWRTSKALLIIAFMLGLVSLNVLTLINDDVHTTGFNALKAILTSVVTDATLSRVLSHSPTQKYAGLEKTHERIEAEFHKFKGLSAKRTEFVKKISPRIARRAISNAGKNLSPPLPGVCAAAITALTASDIFDDCQTLQDLNKLNNIFELNEEDESTVCGLEIQSFKYPYGDLY